MPITVHPVDGFISRLLQQYHRSSSGVQSSSRSVVPSNGENIMIPSQIDDIETIANQKTDKLESSLLGLYNNRGDM